MRTPSLWLLPLTVTALGLPGCGKAPSPSSPPTVLSFQEFVRKESTEIREAKATPDAADPAAPCDAACAKRRQEFRYVVYVGKQIYAYWDLKKADTHLDYDKLASDLEKSIVSDTTITEYYVVLKRWAASFHDGHVSAMYKADSSDLDVYTAPIRLEVLAPATSREKVIISQLAPAQGFDAQQLGLKVGDEVVAINGKPASQALDEAEKLVSGSTARMRRADSVRRLVDILGSKGAATPLALSVARDSSQAPKDVVLYRTAELAVPPAHKGSDAPEPTGADLFHAMMLPGGIGYLRIDGFEGSQDELLIAEAMHMLSASRGLLIDVRRNGGGDQSGNVLLSRLASAAITRYRTSPRMDDYVLAKRPEYFSLNWTPGQPFAAWKDVKVEPAKPDQRYMDRPVVLLTGTDCFSACDTFTSALKTNHLATIVGEPTGGGTGTPLVFELPVTGLRFRYSVVRGQTADGNLFEGVGTQPDHLIERTQAERAAGRDQQLLAALDILGKQIRERAAPTSPASTGNGASSTSPSLDAATIKMLNQAMLQLGPVWEQDETLSPSRALDRKLVRISAFDELER